MGNYTFPGKPQCSYEQIALERCTWSSECEDSFNKTKEALTSVEILIHFDPQVSLGLACDASTVGIGAVLYHRYDKLTIKQKDPLYMCSKH